MPSLPLPLLALLFVFVACCQARPPAEGPALPPAPPAPAPGTAVVYATVDACTREATGYRCMLRVDEVAGYGAGTRPLAEGVALAVDVPLERFEGRDGPALRTPGRRWHVTLQGPAQQMATEQDAAPVWKVVAFHRLDDA